MSDSRMPLRTIAAVAGGSMASATINGNAKTSAHLAGQQYCERKSARGQQKLKRPRMCRYSRAASKRLVWLAEVLRTFQRHEIGLSPWRTPTSASNVRLILMYEPPSDFRRFTSPVKYGRFFDIAGACPGRRIFAGVPKRLGRGVQAINGFVGCTARVVWSCWHLFACLGWAWGAIAFWHCALP
jgi:hypothetical protein